MFHATLPEAASRRAAPETREHGRPRDPAAKRRDPFFDNAKYLAIVLVAIGHAWEPVKDGSHTVSALYLFVYAFHMPAFIVISGYFSRSFEATPQQLRKLVTGVAVPYVLFKLAYTGFERVTGGDPGQPVALLDPWWLTWFLVALFVWRLTTPLWKVVRWPVPLSLAVAALATVSPDIGDDLDMQRVLQFLPFFVTGLFLRPRHFDRLRTRRARQIAVPVLVAAAGFAYWAAEHMNEVWFYHRESAQELGAPWWAGLVMTFAMYGCSLVLTAAFLAVVPRRGMWFSALGAGTLYGFLLHGFVIKGPEAWGWFGAAWVHTPWGIAVITVLAACAVTLLCTPPVRRVFRFAVEPRMGWAFRDNGDARETGASQRETGASGKETPAARS
ncbi:acyltransferase family protein [Streptomyces sp. ODS28]|uniref:acyltransferase family protein n=1 Tax=Streptomyces sp. ODS28 TaxID=3136688 RepID=UPI0031EA90A5